MLRNRWPSGEFPFLLTSMYLHCALYIFKPKTWAVKDSLQEMQMREMELKERKGRRAAKC